MFDNIYEEERNFPYFNMTLKEARDLRYLVRNFYAFKDGELVQMSLKNIEGVITANGMVFEEGKSKTFYSEIKYKNNGVIFYSEIEEIYGNKYYSIDEFNFQEKDIKVSSNIERNGKIVRRIPYREEGLELK